MSDHSDQGLPQGVDGHSHSGTDDLRSGSFTSPVAVNTGPSDPVTPETSLNSEERSLPIEPASEIPPGEVGSSIAAQVAVIIQTNKVRMPTAAIVMQQADVMENQYQVPRASLDLINN